MYCARLKYASDPTAIVGNLIITLTLPFEKTDIKTVCINSCTTIKQITDRTIVQTGTTLFAQACVMKIIPVPIPAINKKITDNAVCGFLSFRLKLPTYSKAIFLLLIKFSLSNSHLFSRLPCPERWVWRSIFFTLSISSEKASCFLILSSIFSPFTASGYRKHPFRDTPPSPQAPPRCGSADCILPHGHCGWERLF